MTSCIIEQHYNYVCVVVVVVVVVGMMYEHCSKVPTVANLL